MKNFLPIKTNRPFTATMGQIICCLLIFFISSMYGQFFPHSTKVFPADGGASDYFGTSVSIDGNTAVIGAYGNDENGGAAYVYQYGTMGWQNTQKLMNPSGPGGVFGITVEVSGNRIIVGDPYYNGRSGAAYIYYYDGINWTLEQELIEPITGYGDRKFGTEVSILGDAAVIGINTNSDGDAGPTKMYFYHRENGIWVVNTVIDGNEGLGDAVAIDSNFIAVTDYSNNSIKIYTYNDANWVMQDSIAQIASTYFRSIDIDGDNLIAGYWSDPAGGFQRGSATVFNYDGNNWNLITKVYSTAPVDREEFGTSVSIEGDYAVIGAPKNFGNGKIYVFQYTDGGWYAQGSASGGNNFGESVSFNGNLTVVGTPRDDPNGIISGSATILEIVARPEPVIVSNGSYTNRNRITWNNDTGQSVSSFNIYRENDLIGTTPGGAVAYNDYESTPGKLHNFGVSVVNDEWGESLPAFSMGWQTLNGSIEGSVKTPYGGGADSVEIEINSTDVQLNSSLVFNDDTDYMIVNPHTNFPDNDITISFWLKTTDANATYPFSYATSGLDNTLTIGNPGNLHVLLGGGNTGGSTISFNDGNWHHLAITWRKNDGEINILKDGLLSFTGLIQPGYSIPGDGSLVLGQEQDAVGGDFDPAQAFNGMLDEVRIWNKIRTPEEIQEFMYKKLNGDEFKLVSYWTFDDMPTRTPDGIAGDYAKDSGNHGKLSGVEYSNESSPVSGIIYTDENGKFLIDNIYYDSSSELELIPFKWGHGFDPDKKLITMDINNYELESVDFIDTTSLTITGTITLEGTVCKAEGVEIILDNTNTGIKTNAAGEFALTIDRPGYYNLKFNYSDSVSSHGFVPNNQYLNVQNDILGMEVLDTTKHALNGMFRGPCEAIIGTADIVISSMGNAAGCFQETITTDSNGDFSIVLPAQMYSLEIINVYPSDPNILGPELVQYFGPEEIDLRWKDQRHDFIYRTTPVIVINDWPEFGQGDYAVPILEQGEFYDLEIVVLDVWGEASCPVNQGSITITDEISGIQSDPVTIELQDGYAYYRCVPDEPNILGGGDNPYQKLFEVVANVGEEIADTLQWALITGSNPRTQTFTATSPEIPFLILRDPPGDQSFSYLSKDSTVSWSTVHSFQPSASATYWWDIRLGVITGVEVGTPFFSSETDWGAYGIFAGAITAGTDHNISTGTFNSISFTEEFSTSDDDQVVGKGGDVFLGASYVNVYALVDVVNYDWENHVVDLDTTLGWEPESIESTFSYTETHIRNVLLPQLKELRSVEMSGENRPDLLNTYNNSISVWGSILLKNDSLKEAAVYSDEFKYKNISFSAGAPYSASYTDASSELYSYDWSIYLEMELAIGVGVVAFGVPSENGITINTSFRYQRVDESQTETTVTTGFTLADDDPGDFFSTNVKTDLVFGTPVFELVAGTSSNPWEYGTQPRDGVNIAMNRYNQYDIPPEDPAPFILYLGNTSESGEEREYHLSVIQASNLDGAIISVGGVVIEDHLKYTIPSGEQLNATLTVERGPIAYDYEKLKIKMYAPGDEEAIADTAVFSVHYISPCSDVTLLIPENNWLVNSSNNDTLQFVINNYDVTNPNLERIKFQYRRVGDAWSTPFMYDLGDLINDFVMEYWEIDHLPDGNYELRAVSDCGQQGVRYSAIASGIIDRGALTLFGKPEPSDGVLNLGEDISFSFSGEIDPAFLSSNNAALITADDSIEIEIEVTAFENELIITPQEELGQYEGQILIATVNNIRDLSGNILRKPESWSFRVNRNPVFWTISNILYTVYQGTSDSFTRTLRNIGGEDESFTITAYPAWLTPSTGSGQIPPGGEQEIIFTVNTQMNVGSYTDTVVVAISSGEEKLIVDLEVLHEPPVWAVAAASYTYNMNMTAVVSFENALSKDIYDIVSVFAEGEIRGVAKIEYLPSVDQYMAFITVYSNLQQGEKLTFRMWDASAGKEYAYLNTDYIFASNSSLGTVNDPVIIRSDASVQFIAMNEGWTWFSLNITAGDMQLDDVLANLTPENGDLIKGQENFSIYHSDFGWQGSLKIIEVGKSYLISLQNGGAINYTGSPVDIYQASIEYKEGWNWIGHLNQNIMSVNETFAMLNPVAGDRIKSQTEFANYMAPTQTWEGSLKNMVPGEGYLLKLSQDAFFQYPLTSISESILPVKPILKKTSISYPAKPEWSVDINAYEYNMSIIIVSSFDGLEMRDSTVLVAAFSDYVCRGVTQLKYIAELEQYVGFLPVYSNKPGDETIYFKLYEPGTDKTRDVTETVQFTSNAVIGDLDAPMVIDAQGIGDELIPDQFYLEQNYPNPFNPETIIEYGIPVDSDVKIILFNVLGQKVATLVDEKQLAHRYKITFDAKEFQLSSGVYFYQIRANKYTQVRKLLYLK